MSEVKISKLRRWGDRGWQWEAEWPPAVAGLDPRISCCRTNEEGDGLFGQGSDGTWGQSLGTLQFQLPDDEERALGAIRQHYAGRW